MDVLNVFSDWWFSDPEATDYTMLLFRLLTLGQWLLAIALLLSSLSCIATVWRLEGARTWLPVRLVVNVSPATANGSPPELSAGETIVPAIVMIDSPGVLVPIFLAIAAFAQLWINLPTLLPEVIVEDPERFLSRLRG